jgi:CheY-like chemotaxis protein
VAPAAEAKGVQLSTVVEPFVLRISGDAGRLQQVVWNLLSNAVKFTPAGGRVTIVLARSEDQAVIRVSDTGKGIRAEFLPYVFERFQQADSATTRLHGGLGLGLAIVRHLVELHGGTVSVVSAGEGRGATFSVALPMRVELSLPRYEGPRAGTAAPEPAEVAATILAGVRVLVVDDQEDARDLIVAALEHHGARVVAAASAGEAMSALIREKPDVLVSDVAMPGEDGYSLMRQVRALAPNPAADVPALAVTAYARREDRSRAIAAGYRAHLAKPVEPARLARAVASLAGRATRPSSGRT